jgi:hypothetical protein
VRIEAGLRGTDCGARRLGRTSWASGICWASWASWAMVRRASGFGWAGNWRWAGGASGSGWAGRAVVRMMVVIVMRFPRTTGRAIGVTIPAVDRGISIVGHGRFIRCKVQHHPLHFKY